MKRIHPLIRVIIILFTFYIGSIVFSISGHMQDIKEISKQQVIIDSLNIQIMQKDSLIKDQAALIENYQLLYELGE